MTQKIRVKIRGKPNPIVLTPAEYITAGGEGAIYKQGNVIYKIFHPGRKGLNAMEQKISLLSAIKHKGIIAPADPLYDAKDDLIGFTMPFITGEVLVRFFGNDYRKKNKFGIQESISVVHGMKDIVQAAHAAKALMVDGNEMNYLVEGGHGWTPWIIDVDSWQIGPHKATAIMASIRDYQSQNFSEVTDWFSWAIVTFQLFTGIHPFKGGHPNYKPTEMVERMKQNVSVFNPQVRVPAAARGVSEIPANLRNWYEAAFQKGERTIPPDNFDVVATPKVLQKTVYARTGSKLVYTKWKEFASDVISVLPNGVVITKDRLFTRTSRVGILHNDMWNAWGYDFHCVTTENGVLVANNSNKNKLYLVDGDSFEELKLDAAPNKFFSGNNRLFAVNGNGMAERKIMVLGGNKHHIMGTKWHFNPFSTYFGDGVAVYDALGMPHVVLPFEEAGVLVSPEKELQHKVVVSAKAIDKFVTCLVKDQSGDSFKIELFYGHPNGPIRWSAPTDETGLNFSVNHRGVVATIVNDGELVLFDPVSGKSQSISDKNIETDMTLCSVNDNIGFFKQNEVWSLATA